MHIQVVLLCFCILGLSTASADTPNVRAEHAYPLDGVARKATKTKRGLQCPEVDLVSHPGTTVKYHKPVKVYSGFVPHLKRFEEVVRETAIAYYGRAPKRIRHMGTYNCRKIKGYPNLISEHGVGNGIDVSGFDFGPLPQGVDAKADLPKSAKRAFKIRLIKHWQAKPKTLHARFLNTLAKRLWMDSLTFLLPCFSLPVPKTSRALSEIESA